MRTAPTLCLLAALSLAAAAHAGGMGATAQPPGEPWECRPHYDVVVVGIERFCLKPWLTDGRCHDDGTQFAASLDTGRTYCVDHEASLPVRYPSLQPPASTAGSDMGGVAAAPVQREVPAGGGGAGAQPPAGDSWTLAMAVVVAGAVAAAVAASRRRGRRRGHGRGDLGRVTGGGGAYMAPQKRGRAVKPAAPLRREPAGTVAHSRPEARGVPKPVRVAARIDPEECVVVPDANVMVDYMEVIGKSKPGPGKGLPDGAIRGIIDTLSNSKRLYMASNVFEEVRGVVWKNNDSRQTGKKCEDVARRLVAEKATRDRIVADNNKVEEMKDQVGIMFERMFAEFEEWRTHVEKKHHMKKEGRPGWRRYEWKECIPDLTTDKAILAKASCAPGKGDKARVLLTRDEDFLIARRRILDEFGVHVMSPDEWAGAAGQG